MTNLRTFIGTALVVMTAFGAGVSSAEAAALARDLSLGSVGEDVRELQRFLNIDPATRVATEGAGSPGNESTYFGPATAAAVARFQAKYPDETYRKAGLAAANGFAGALTRQAINARMGYSVAASAYSGAGFVYDPAASALPAVTAPAYDAPVQTSADAAREAYLRSAAATIAVARVNAYSYVRGLGASTTVGVAPAGPVATTSAATSGNQTNNGDNDADPVVMFVAPRVVEAGDRVTVFGVAMPSDLRVKVGSSFVRVKSIKRDGVQGYFKVPSRLDDGEYVLEFSSKKEAQDLSAPFDETLTVVEKVVAPEVTDAPEVFESGATVTIEGKNFSSNGETYLVGAFGRLRAVRSTEREATFVLPTVEQIIGRPVQIPNGVQPRTMVLLIETDQGVGEGFEAVVRLF